MTTPALLWGEGCPHKLQFHESFCPPAENFGSNTFFQSSNTSKGWEMCVLLEWSQTLKRKKGNAKQAIFGFAELALWDEPKTRLRWPWILDLGGPLLQIISCFNFPNIFRMIMIYQLKEVFCGGIKASLPGRAQNPQDVFSWCWVHQQTLQHNHQKSTVVSP